MMVRMEVVVGGDSSRDSTFRFYQQGADLSACLIDRQGGVAGDIIREQVIGACPMLRRSLFAPLNWNAEVRPTTRRSGTLANAVVISSVMPSEKNSCSVSEDIFRNGRTATETAPFGDAAAARAAATDAC